MFCFNDACEIEDFVDTRTRQLRAAVSCYRAYYGLYVFYGLVQDKNPAQEEIADSGSVLLWERMISMPSSPPSAPLPNSVDAAIHMNMQEGPSHKQFLVTITGDHS